MKTRRQSPQAGSSESPRSKRVAFIVKGPPTYMNAEEAQFQANLRPDECTLFIVLPSLNAFSREERMEKIIDNSRWQSVHWITCRTKNKYLLDKQGQCRTIQRSPIRRLATHVADALKIKWIAIRQGRYDLAYTVHNGFHEYLACSLRPDQVIIIEAGLSTLNRIEKSGYIDYLERASGSLKWIYRLAGFKRFDRLRTALFTSYSTEVRTKHRLIVNKNSLKRSQCANLWRGDYALWIGTPLCELHGYCFDFYRDLIKAGLRECNLPSEGMVYIPHPGKESQIKLRRIVNDLNCKIDDRLLPVEIKISRGSSLPCAILTPFSSALINLEQILPPEVQLISVWHNSFFEIPGLAEWRRMTRTCNARIRFADISAPS